MFKNILYFFCLCAALYFNSTYASDHNVIVYVWDGLRPDSVTPTNTPNLYRLMKAGVDFKDNHSSYPTFTMMNAASFATGDFAGKTGFFGNILWHPGIKGLDSSGKSVDFHAPVFTEDYKILQDLDSDKLIFVPTLFEQAYKKGLKIAAIGKSGPAFFQDYHANGFVVDEKHVYPLSFAQQLQQEGYSLPKLSPLAFKPDTLKLSIDNGDPTAAEKIYKLNDGVTPDPTDNHGSPFAKANQYMMQIYLNKILPQKPTISVVWMRDPDSTEHQYGPGTANYIAALKNNDHMLGALEIKLKTLSLWNNTNIIVVSDHSHSSVSSEVRSADLLTQAGFHTYDGEGCHYNPVMSGIPTRIDETGTICGEKDQKFTTPSYKMPAHLPNDVIVVAANGGSDYFYVPSHDKKLVQKFVAFLQSNKYYDVIFTDAQRYSIPGTFPLSIIHLENKNGRTPDVIAGFSYNAKTKIHGLPGIKFSDSANMRGMHGSFSPVDVHNFLMAYGPDFRKKFQDNLPTGNVDVAPTIAYLLGLNLPNTDGRVLHEALLSDKTKDYQVKQVTLTSPETAKVSGTTYQPFLYIKTLSIGNQSYNYFDKAEAVRK